jgi:CitB family two-component system sensor histidine kinase CitS
MDQEIVWKKQNLIVNSTPILNDRGEVAGVVASFRDRSEIERMINTLSEVRKYSEDLRAQSHEYTNKLHVISGLLQLGAYDEVVMFIQEETKNLQSQQKRVFENIKDAKVQAILLGKLGKASEKKIVFDIDPNSSLQPLPNQISLSQLIIIIGNLLDNAFEAVSQSEAPAVLFFATDIGEDIIFEITDIGIGMDEKMINQLFKRGFTTKNGEGQRGFGLANVSQAVHELGGFIEVHSKVGKGATFTIYLPKTKGED